LDKYKNRKRYDFRDNFLVIMMDLTNNISIRIELAIKKLNIVYKINVNKKYLIFTVMALRENNRLCIGK